MRLLTCSVFLFVIGLAGAAWAGQDDSCHAASSTPGCADLACETAVCAIDGYCCSTAWDGTCVWHSEAFDECGVVADLSAPVVDVVFSLVDTYGDGWNGNAITVWNSFGEPVGAPITLAAGAAGTIALPLVPDTYSVTWSAKGGWPAEVSFSIFPDAISLAGQVGDVLRTFAVSGDAICRGEVIEQPKDAGVQLTLVDAYGDGWNGNAITIWNSLGESVGEPITLAAGAKEVIALPLAPGSYSIRWSEKGDWVSEASFAFSGSSDDRCFYSWRRGIQDLDVAAEQSQTDFFLIDLGDEEPNWLGSPEMRLWGHEVGDALASFTFFDAVRGGGAQLPGSLLQGTFGAGAAAPVSVATDELAELDMDEQLISDGPSAPSP